MTPEEREQQLAFLLQTSLDFAFRQMAQGKRLIPFATRVAPDGAIDFHRAADEDTQLPLGQVHDLAQQVVRRQAVAGELVAAALVASVRGEEQDLSEGFSQAMRVQVEMPGYCRMIFQPYRIEPRHDGAKGELVMGTMVTTATHHVIFGSAPGTGNDGPTIFSLT